MAKKSLRRQAVEAVLATAMGMGVALTGKQVKDPGEFWLRLRGAGNTREETRQQRFEDRGVAHAALELDAPEEPSAEEMLFRQSLEGMELCPKKVAGKVSFVSVSSTEEFTEDLPGPYDNVLSEQRFSLFGDEVIVGDEPATFEPKRRETARDRRKKARRARNYARSCALNAQHEANRWVVASSVRA